MQRGSKADPAAPLEPPQWSHAARKLADNGVTLIAPDLPNRESPSTQAASARNRRPSAGCADAGFQGSSAEHDDMEGHSPSSSVGRAATPDASLSGRTGSSPLALTAILPSVQAGPQQHMRGRVRHNASGHMATPPAAVDAGSPPWRTSSGPVLVSAPVAGTNAFADVDEKPHCHSATQPSTEAALPENDLEVAPQLQDSAKV